MTPTHPHTHRATALGTQHARPARRRRLTAAAGLTAVAALATVAVPGTAAATADTLVSDPTTGAQALAPAAAHDPATGRHLIVWTSMSATGKAHIRGRFVDSRGVPAGTEFVIATVGDADDPTTDAVEPTVAHHPASGRFIVAYAADADEDTSGTAIDFRIHARTITADGTLSTPSIISDQHTGDDLQINARQPALAVNTTTGRVLAVWEDDEHGTTDRSDRYEIHGRLLTVGADGSISTTGSEMVLSTTGTGDGSTAAEALDARSPSAAYHPDLDHFAVAWDSEHAGDDATGIIGQLLTGDGTPTGGDIVIDPPTGLDFHPVLVATRTGFTAVWERDDDLVWRDLDVVDGALRPTGAATTLDPELTGDAVRTPAAVATPNGTDLYAVWASTDDDAAIRGTSLRTRSAATIISDHDDHAAISSSVSRPALSLGADDALLVVWSGVEPGRFGTAQIWLQVVDATPAASALPSVGAMGDLRVLAVVVLATGVALLFVGRSRRRTSTTS